MIGRLAPWAIACAAAALPATAQTPPNAPWTNRTLNPDARADLVVRAMTADEKLTLLTGYYGVDQPWEKFTADPLARPQSAGYVPGVPRLGITPQWQTDAGSGVATQGKATPALERTALPAGILTASTWNPALAERGGAMIGAEARASGFNIMLAGGVNLLRDPRNGRNFEYGGEDPLLAGTMTAAVIRGIQSNRIVSTVKHFALNDQETGRNFYNGIIDDGALRMSDLLAFQFAIEGGDPGSVMCAYNKVNGAYSCENDYLLNQVLKRDWGFAGYVMSDWGGTHSTVDAANNGLDQENGINTPQHFFLEKLKAAVAVGTVPAARLDDMARRVLRAMFASGALDDVPAPAPIDFAAHEAVAQADAEEGIVLLKNARGVLPLANARRIAVIGGNADKGVLSGGGSAQVYARGGNVVPGLGPQSWPGPHVYYNSSPLAALRAARPGATIDFADGRDVAAAARLAKSADVVLVFATQWTAESLDFSMTLPDKQDALVAAVAAANPRTVVVLETGGPVLMPWIDRVAGVVEAWYPGSRGGQAIAHVLTGAVNPSGHLPATFPASLVQLPRPRLDGEGLPAKTAFDVRYHEGAAVGYKWFDKQGLRPLFPFGHGMSYTSFRHDGLSAAMTNGELTVRFRVTNTGARAGKEVAQIYVAPVEANGWEAPKRLGGYAKLDLAPGASETGAVTVDPRLLGVWDARAGGWRVAGGRYRVTLAQDAADPGRSVIVTVPERRLPAGRGAAVAKR